MRYFNLAASIIALVWLTFKASNSITADDAAKPLTADELRRLDAFVFPVADRPLATRQLPEKLRQQLLAANSTSSAEWQGIMNRSAWEAFRDSKLKTLRQSLGVFPVLSKSVTAHTSGTVQGDGFVINNILLESRQGVWISANLYRPSDPSPVANRPGIILCHSHHTPKTHGELQDMGMTWARLGCVVLVPDHIGHGERRQHPFATEKDFATSFRPSRQDYYFRYDISLQLDIAGQSLIGQIVFDLTRCVDFLLSLPEVDSQRIALLGAVAGGGDPCAVAAALDTRISAAVPFNFGGPQPETRYPLPEDAETSFHYAGSGGWESTRNLRNSAADGFLPWAIVGGIAPRRLIYGHEFRWDRERDPVWKRLQTIYAWYGLPGNLAFTHGHGELRGQPAEASHCTHIGSVHRKLIHSEFTKWFGIPDGTVREYSQRRSSEELMCWNAEFRERLKPMPLRDILKSEATISIERTRSELAPFSPARRREELRQRWGQLLLKRDSGRSAGAFISKVVSSKSELAELPRVASIRTVLETEMGVSVPLLLLQPTSQPAGRPIPVVVGVSQSGKQAFLSNRSQAIGQLLNAGIAVCLPDVRGTGELSSSAGRDRTSSATAYSSSQQMLGDSLFAARLHDLRAVLRYLRTLSHLDGNRVALWGDSFAEPNPIDRPINVPHGIDDRPKDGEPLGGLLALFGTLFDSEIRAVYVRGGLVSFRSLLEGPCVYIPHDAVIPGALSVSELSDVAAALAPLPIQLSDLISGTNQVASEAIVRSEFAAAKNVYQGLGMAGNLKIATGDGVGEKENTLAQWFEQHLRPPAK